MGPSTVTRTATGPSSDEVLNAYDRRLFAEAGVPHLAFSPAIFWFYDMFFAASRMPLMEITDTEVAARLTSPGQRTVLALADLYTRWEGLNRQIQDAHRDRLARLVVIEALDKQLQECLARSRQ